MTFLATVSVDQNLPSVSKILFVYKQSALFLEVIKGSYL